jgi:prevent-host-death family protein
MPTYTITQFKAKASEILDNLEAGDEVIITRRGKPCGKLTAVTPPVAEEPSIDRLKARFAKLPDLEYEDFQEAKRIWDPKPLPVEAHGAE